MEKSSSNEYLAGINFLRAIAIMGVVLYHLLPHKVPGGFMGVCLFFMISGYLLFRTSDRDYKKTPHPVFKFYAKKIRRIYPSLFLIVIAATAYFTLLEPELLTGIREEVLSIFLGYNNWWQISQNASYFDQISSHSPFTHLWFLSVELQLYLVWPLIFGIYKLLEKNLAQDKALIFLLVLAVISGSLMGILYSETNVTRVYYGTDTRAYALFLGALCAAAGKNERIFPNLRKNRCLSTLIFILCLLCLALIYCFVDGESLFLYRGGMVLLCLLFGVLLFFVCHTPIKDSLCLSWFPLRWLGEKSFTIYLWHYPLIFMINLWR